MTDNKNNKNSLSDFIFDEVAKETKEREHQLRALKMGPELEREIQDFNRKLNTAGVATRLAARFDPETLIAKMHLLRDQSPLSIDNLFLEVRFSAAEDRITLYKHNNEAAEKEEEPLFETSSKNINTIKKMIAAEFVKKLPVEDLTKFEALKNEATPRIKPYDGKRGLS